MMKRLIVPALLFIGACSTSPSSEVVITEVDPSNLPQSVRDVIAQERPDFEIEEVLRKVRDGRTYYDVEGETADGGELEFDVLMNGSAAEIVEVQRDLDWANVPDEAKAIVLMASDDVHPVRTIESVQADGSVIYEFFAEGQPSDPSWEVRSHAGNMKLLTDRWIH